MLRAAELCRRVTCLLAAVRAASNGRASDPFGGAGARPGDTRNLLNCKWLPSATVALAPRSMCRRPSGGRSAPLYVLSRVACSMVEELGFRERPHGRTKERLLTVDHSARESMKDAAKCEK